MVCCYHCLASGSGPRRRRELIHANGQPLEWTTPPSDDAQIIANGSLTHRLPFRDQPKPISFLSTVWYEGEPRLA